MSGIIVLILKALKGLASLSLQPLVPASCLAFIAYGPRDLVDRLVTHEALRKFLGRVGATNIQTPLGILLGLGTIRLLNQIANRRALNNWRLSPNQEWAWSGELAVVTGGCNGIGRAMVLGLAQKGVTVAILDVSEMPNDLATNEKIHYWKCDITSSAAVRQAADEIRATLGHPSILINNAGVAGPHSILDTTEKQLRKVFDVNLLSLWSTTQEFLPNMILKNKGHIVTVASAASFAVLPTIVDYASSKAGAMAFHEGLVGEIRHVYKAPGVMATAVHPLWVMTNMTAKDAGRIEKSSGGKLMVPDDIAKPVLQQIFSCRGGQLIIPGSASWLAGARGLPNWMFEALRDMSAKGL